MKNSLKKRNAREFIQNYKFAESIGVNNMDLIDRLLSDSTPFVIYGAQVVAYGAYNAIANLCNRKPKCFVVSNLENNPSDIDGIPVLTLDSVQKDWLIIIGVTELLQTEIVLYLEERGYTNYFLLTQREEHMLMSRHYKNINQFPMACFQDMKEDIDFVMYEVGNHRDKSLSNSPLLQTYETKIQAGAALTDVKIAMLQDNTGDNISERNRQYCEMSAVYWIWKNTNHEWTGIEHYRRHLHVKPEMLHEDIDVLMPLPYMCYPYTVAQFRRFVSEDVLQLLLKALRDLHPEQYPEYNRILYGKYQYTYNLLCARRQVFEDYCGWFFEITEYMERISDEVPAIKDTRALSYVAEVLTNLYFMHNEKKWNIVHVEKSIYI